MKDHTSTTTLESTTYATTISTPIQHLGAFLLGVIIVYGVGFLNVSVTHNAAHDTRHSAGFPCH